MPSELKEGIDDSQWEMIENALKVSRTGLLKTKTSRTQSQQDIDKWFAIWKIIFPGSPEPSNPCRYHYSSSRAPLN
jgi:hypothetical protein